MEIRLSPALLKGAVALPASKSYAHRQMIAAAFADGESVLYGDFTSRDCRATMDVLCALGATITPLTDGEGIAIRPGTRPACAVCDCGESGSTLRFSVPISAALGVQTEFIGHGRLGERPMDALKTSLEAHGITFAGRGLPLVVSGQLQAGEYCIDGSESSQYITGLLLALPLLKGDSKLTVTGARVSQGYIDITLDVLANCGARVEKVADGYLVHGVGQYTACGERTVEGDWSNAAFWLAAGLLGDGIAVSNLNPASRQGDKRVLDLMRLAGGKIEWEGERLVAYPSKLKAIRFDADDIPDAVPAMAVLLATARGESVISGVERLRIKESDRLAAVIDILTRLGAPARYENGKLYITGVEHFRGAVLETYNDHRLVMAGAVAASRAAGEITLLGAQAVEKSYPAFFKEYQKLGGDVCLL